MSLKIHLHNYVSTNHVVLQVVKRQQLNSTKMATPSVATTFTSTRGTKMVNTTTAKSVLGKRSKFPERLFPHSCHKTLTKLLLIIL